jgi:hypothetical protein
MLDVLCLLCLQARFCEAERPCIEVPWGTKLHACNARSSSSVRILCLYTCVCAFLTSECSPLFQRGACIPSLPGRESSDMKMSLNLYTLYNGAGFGATEKAGKLKRPRWFARPSPKFL